MGALLHRDVRSGAPPGALYVLGAGLGSTVAPSVKEEETSWR